MENTHFCLLLDVFEMPRGVYGGGADRLEPVVTKPAGGLGSRRIPLLTHIPTLMVRKVHILHFVQSSGAPELLM